MSTQTRVPTGVPTGGQFSASAKSEAAIDPWSNYETVEAVPARDSWADAPRSPFRPLLAGLTDEQDNEFRDLDEPVAVLRPENLSLTQKKQYLVLAAGVDGAMAKGAEGWLPSCPVHGVNMRTDLGSSAANQWGGDDTCTACTENGDPLPLAARLSLTERLTTEEVGQVRDRMERVAQTKARNSAEGALDQAKSLFAVSEDQADYLEGDQIDAMVAFDAAFDQALFTYQTDHDTAALAQTLDGIVENEGARFADLVHGEDSEGIDWLRTAADRFRAV